MLRPDSSPSAALRPRASRSHRICGFLLLLLVAGAAPAAAQINLGTYSIGQVEIPLGAPDTWSFDSGTLPPGISLRSDPPPWAPFATATLSGVATADGNYFFNLLKSGVSTSYTVRISPLAVKDSYRLSDAFVNVFYSHQLTAINSPGAAGALWTVTPGTLPPGMTLSATGLLSGTPTVSGFYNVNFTVNDGTDTVFRSVSVNVYAVQILVPGAQADGSLPNATVNVPYSAAVTASGGSGSYTFTSNSLPTGLVLNASSGEISGTVTSGSGKWSFTITATDSDGISYSRAMSIDVIGAPPTLPNVSPYGNFFDDCSFGVPCTRGIGVWSGGRAPFTWSAIGLPAGTGIRSGSAATSWWITPGDAELWGTPTELGTFPVQVTVTDADGLTGTNTFDLKVGPLWLWNYLNGGFIGDPYSQTFRVLGGTLPYSAALGGGRLPVGLGLAGLTVSGTPMENGSFTAIVDFTDNDGTTLRAANYLFIGSHTSTVNLNSFDDLGTIGEGAFYSNQLQACCVPSYSWTIIGGGLPVGLTLSSGGLLSGTPGAGTSGTYTFMVRVEDATNPLNYAVHQFKLVVTTLSLSSSFSLPFGNVGSPYNGSGFLLTVTGAVGAVTWTLEPFQYLPPGLTLHANGLIDGTPTGRGQFYFTAKATDSAVPVPHILKPFFSITIYGVGEGPPLDLPLGPSIGPIGLGTLLFQLSATGGTPPYHYSYSPGATAIPGVRVQDGQPLPTFFAPSVTGGLLGVITTAGTYNTSIRVTDSAAQTLDRAITVTVSPLQLLSQSPLPKATLGAPYSFTLVPYGGTAYSWSANNLPPGLSIDSSGQIFGTPTSAGVFFPGITLTDLATSNSTFVGISITVNPFAIATGGVLPSGVAGTFYSQSFSAPGCGVPCAWSVQGSLPFGLSLSGGVLSGTPSTTFNSFFTASVTGTAGTVQKVFSLRIASSTPQPLSITNSSFSDVTVGNQVSFALFAQGGTPPYSWSLQAGSTLPTGVSLQGPGETLGANLGPGFTYLAGRAMQTGTYNFTVQVTDATATTVSKPFTWKISPLSFQYFSLPLFAGSPLVYNVAYTQALLVIGGTNSYAWTSSAMPPGLTLNPATGVVTGMPSNTGFFNVPIQATDGALNSMTSNVSFNVSGPTATTLTFTSGPNFGTIQHGTTTTFNISLSNGTPPFAMSALTPLPPGFALVPQSGGPAGSVSVSGIALTPGSFSFTIQALDSLGNLGVRTFTLTVASFSLLSPTQTLPNASVGTPYSHSLLALDSGGVTWSLASGSSYPPGVSVSPTGDFSGTPTTPGTFNFQLTATQGGVSVNFFFSLRISNINITDPSFLPEATLGLPFTPYTFTATGGGMPKAWSATGLPRGLMMSAAGTISGTPSSSANSGVGSSFSVLVTVTDGTVAFSRRFTLFVRFPVRRVLDVPTPTTLLADAIVGRGVSYTLTANDGVPPYTFMLAPGSILPPGMSLLSGAALLAGQFAPGTTVLAGAPTLAGDYTFDLIATDSAGTEAQRTYSLHVASLGVIGTLTAATTGTSYSVQFVGVGGTSPYTFSMIPTNPLQDMLPPGLTMSLDGRIFGVPTSTGPYAFRLLATDASDHTFSQSFNLTVMSPSGLRIVNFNPADARVGHSISEQLFTNGNSTYTWTLVAGLLPPGTALGPGESPNTTVLSGRPTTPGTFNFTLRATDNANAANTADHAFTFNVTSMQIVSPPGQVFGSPAFPSAHVGDPTFIIKVAGGTPPYSFVQSPFRPLPPGLTLSPAGVLAGTVTSVGNFIIAPIITDADSHTFRGERLTLVVTQPGTPVPFFADSEVQFPDGSAGVPYSFPPLDLFLQGGTPPFTLSVAPGSALPPGMDLRPGGNGVPTYLGGVPSTPGSYGFSLMAMDSSGQTITVPVMMNVSPLSLWPDTLPAGKVGTSYSVSLVPTGGLSPYTIQLFPDSDMPPGLTLDASGMLSGTPLYPGNFLIGLMIEDSGGNSLFKFDVITIDNAAGEAPAVTLAPNPIQIYYELGSTPPGPTPVAVQTMSGAEPFTLNLSGAPWASLSAGDGTAPSSVYLSVDVGSLGLGTYVGLLGMHALSSANQDDAAPVLLSVVAPPPCSYMVNPTAGSVPAGGGTGGFDVGAGSSCSWTAVASDLSWITITGVASGTGNGTVSYSVAPNGGASQRSGTITVNGAVYTITQFGSDCSFAINPMGLTATAAGGFASISITASGPACTWDASGLGASPPNGLGNDDVTVVIPANPDQASRILTATIAGQTLTVNQSGAACTVALSSPSASYSSGGGSGSVMVTTPAGCSYGTVLGPSWINVTSGGSGTGSDTLLYSVNPNSTTFSRSGTLTIGGHPFQITEEALACSATIDTSGLGSPFDSTGGLGNIGITMNGPNCSWNASSPAGWASVSPPSGTGDGTVFVNVGSNASSPTGRSIDLSIAGQTVGLSEAGTICTYALQSANGTAPASGGSGSVGVVAPPACTWTSVSNDMWLTISSSGSAGSSDVHFVAQPNPSSSPRSGTLTITGLTASLTYTVDQAPAPCSYTLSSTNVTVSEGGASDAFTFSTTTGICSPDVTSYAGWVHVSSSFVGMSWSVSFSADPNPFALSRTGVIQVGGQTFTVTQLGSVCAFSLNAYGAWFNTAGGSSYFLGSPSALACSPTGVGVDLPSIATLGSLTGPLLNIFTQQYTVLPFIGALTPVVRRARITFGGQIFTIKQSSW